MGNRDTARAAAWAEHGKQHWRMYVYGPTVARFLLAVGIAVGLFLVGRAVVHGVGGFLFPASSAARSPEPAREPVAPSPEPGVVGSPSRGADDPLLVSLTHLPPGVWLVAGVALTLFASWCVYRWKTRNDPRRVVRRGVRL